MRRLSAFLAILGILAIAALALRATAQEGPPGGPPGPGGQDGGGPGGPPPPDHRGGPGGGFHLLPRFVAEKLNLTDEQQRKIAKLERETKAKLDKILTPEQRKTLDEARPPRPGEDGPNGGRGRPRGGPGGSGPGGGGPGGGGGQHTPNGF